MKVATFYTLLLFVSLTLPVAELHGQTGNDRFFEQTGGPTGGGRYLTVGHDGVLFAGAIRNFYRSTDNGLSWTRTLRKETIDSFYHPEFFPQPNSVVFATISQVFHGSSELYRSNDNGVGWRKLAGFPSVGYISGVSMASDGSYVLIADSGVYRQGAEQSEWKRIVPSESAFTYRIASVGSGGSTEGELYRVDHVIRRSDSGTFAVAFRSLDDGTSWERIGDTVMLPRRLHQNNLRLLVMPDGELFMMVNRSSTSGVVLRLARGGGAWEERMNGLPPNSTFFKMAPGASGRLYLGAVNLGVYTSSDHGAEWTALPNDRIRFPVDIIEAAQGVILVATTTIYRSADSGSSWTKSDAGIVQSNCFRLATAPDGSVLTSVGEVLYKTSDEGRSWEEVRPPAAPGTIISVIEVDSSGRIYVATSAQRTGSGAASSIARSDDGGVSWQTITTGFSASSTWDIGIRGDLLFAATDAGIYRSTDRGDEWTPVTNGLPTMNIRSLLVTRSGDLLVGTRGAGLWRSRDNGETWQDANTGVAATSIWCIEQSPNGTLYALAEVPGEGVYRSSDRGETWTDIQESLPPHLRLMSLAVNRRGDLFAAVQMPDGINDLIARSNDDGAHWSVIDSGFVTWRLAVDAYDRVWAATSGDGVWLGRETITHVAAEHSRSPRLDLDARAAGSELVLHYHLPSAAPATIALVDPLGRQVRIITGIEETAGTHTLLLDIGDLAGGIYYLHLAQREQSETVPVTIRR